MFMWFLYDFIDRTDCLCNMWDELHVIADVVTH